MDELKFDTMEANMKLAEDFLATHNGHLEKLQSRDKESAIELKEFANMDVDSQNSDFYFILEELAKKVQENAELIAQLAILTQGKVKDVLDYDLKLIEENFKDWSSRNVPEILKLYRCIWILDFLGYVVKTNIYISSILIQYNSSTLPVTYLFARLCFQVGIRSEALKFQRCAEKEITKILIDGEFNGCTAVVCEQADVDSAVDSILTSASHDPWQIHRVYVQENVYDAVKRAFSWKCGLKDKQEASDILNLISLKYGTKTLIFDYAGRETESSETNQTIFVEAYRTVKELLSLLKKGNSFCLSVWSSDVSVSNEIAFNVTSPIVWINDYGTVDGPVTRAFTTTCTPDYKYECTVKFRKLIDDWTKLSTNERIEKIYKALQEFENENNDEKSRDLINKIKKVLKYIPSNKSFENTDGKMWIKMQIPKRVEFIAKTVQYSFEYVEHLMISAARGNVIVSDKPLKENHTDIYSNLLFYLCQNSPFVNSYNTNKSLSEISTYHQYRERVIVINYGTIFAN